MRLIERRITDGRYEWQCRCGEWYSDLATHIHDHHRATCRCKKVCNPDPPK